MGINSESETSGDNIERLLVGSDSEESSISLLDQSYFRSLKTLLRSVQIEKSQDLGTLTERVLNLKNEKLNFLYRCLLAHLEQENKHQTVLKSLLDTLVGAMFILETGDSKDLEELEELEKSLES